MLQCNKSKQISSKLLPEACSYNVGRTSSVSSVSLSSLCDPDSEVVCYLVKGPSRSTDMSSRETERHLMQMKGENRCRPKTSESENEKALREKCKSSNTAGFPCTCGGD